MLLLSVRALPRPWLAGPYHIKPWEIEKLEQHQQQHTRVAPPSPGALSAAAHGRAFGIRPPSPRAASPLSPRQVQALAREDSNGSRFTCSPSSPGMQGGLLPWELERLEEARAQPASPRATSPRAQPTSPRALSPQALSPQALSPRAMSPQPMSPRAMSPLAMSPRAMSPEPESPRAQPTSPRAQPSSPRAQPSSPRAQPSSPRAQPSSPRAQVAPWAQALSPRAPAAPWAQALAPPAQPADEHSTLSLDVSTAASGTLGQPDSAVDAGVQTSPARVVPLPTDDEWWALEVAEEQLTQELSRLSVPSFSGGMPCEQGAESGAGTGTRASTGAWDLAAACPPRGCVSSSGYGSGSSSGGSGGGGSLTFPRRCTVNGTVMGQVFGVAQAKRRSLTTSSAGGLPERGSLSGAVAGLLGLPAEEAAAGEAAARQLLPCARRVTTTLGREQGDDSLAAMAADMCGGSPLADSCAAVCEVVVGSAGPWGGAGSKQASACGQADGPGSPRPPLQRCYERRALFSEPDAE